jgi:molecular chaperone HscB
MSHPDHFELFGLPPRFAIDPDALEHAYRDVQARVHPDRFAAGTPAERRVAMQWATRANEAYTTLRSPQKRAAYLVERAGASIDAETNTAMPPAFLMQQMEWREALDEARGNAAALDELRATVDSERGRLLSAIGQAIDETRDYAQAASLVRQLMFVDRYASEIDLAEEAMHASRASA